MTKRFGLIGYPLKNSFSEQYFNSKFLKLALTDHIYQNFPIKTVEEYTVILNENPDLAGLNVTIPYKESIIPFLDELDETAEKIGAVNCIKIIQAPDRRIKMTGFNTDVVGFEESLLPLIRNNMPEKALILGTGGAAKAVAYVLDKNGISYSFVSRKHENETGHIRYDQLSGTTIRAHQLIVNCTPLGMYPDTDAAPDIAYNHITPDHVAYDLIYLPVETLFLKKCREQGAITKNGLEMLHLQAEEAWKIFQNKK